MTLLSDQAFLHVFHMLIKDDYTIFTEKSWYAYNIRIQYNVYDIRLQWLSKFFYFLFFTNAINDLS